jgi:hypothetical protein
VARTSNQHAKSYQKKEVIERLYCARPQLADPSVARDLDIDLKRAGIPKTTREGKIDFPACRVAYITHLIETGADVKTVQTLARIPIPASRLRCTRKHVRSGWLKLLKLSDGQC